MSLVFLLVLSLTGIGLNHSAQWRLDARYLDWSWLLSWYGFETPPPGASFAAADRRVTRVGTRLYLDDIEAVRGVRELVGAVAMPPLVVAATSDALLYLSPDGELVDRLELAAELEAPIEALGAARSLLVLTSGERVLALDEWTATTRPYDGETALIAWAEPSALPPPLERAIARTYRGPGVSIERLLLDLHNGSLFARAGPWLLDAAGVLLIALSITGLVIWFKRLK